MEREREREIATPPQRPVTAVVYRFSSSTALEVPCLCVCERVLFIKTFWKCEFIVVKVNVADHMEAGTTVVIGSRASERLSVSCCWCAVV